MVNLKPLLLLWVLVFCLATRSLALEDSSNNASVTSTRKQAMDHMKMIRKLETSVHWPNIDPVLFLKNLKANIQLPLGIYPGKGTNFCGFGALTYLFLLDDPLGYAKLLLDLYHNGKATFRTTELDPSPAIKLAAGNLKFKGALDINPAEQMWYLTLAGHYKGYLNIFNRKYDPGDEDLFWASVNYAKFNRMCRRMLGFKVRARGTDLVRPKSLELYPYISERLATGRVVLFINNRIVHKKNHVTLKLGIPTHFIVAEKISKKGDMITLEYWDYGRKTQLQMSDAFFKRIVFGITHYTKPTDAD